MFLVVEPLLPSHSFYQTTATFRHFPLMSRTLPIYTLIGIGESVRTDHSKFFASRKMSQYTVYLKNGDAFLSFKMLNSFGDDFEGQHCVTWGEWTCIELIDKVGSINWTPKDKNLQVFMVMDTLTGCGSLWSTTGIEVAFLKPGGAAYIPPGKAEFDKTIFTECVPMRTVHVFIEPCSFAKYFSGDECYRTDVSKIVPHNINLYDVIIVGIYYSEHLEMVKEMLRDDPSVIMKVYMDD